MTWSETQKNAHVVLLNGDLTATTDGSSFTNFLGRSIDAAAVGLGDKKYWEITINTQTSGGTNGVGIMNALGLGDSFLGQTANSLSYFGIAGNVQYNGTSPATLAPFANGDVIGVAINGAGKIWFRVNSDGWNNDIPANQNPATNTGGIDISLLVGAGSAFPAYNLQQEDANDQQTANFGHTAFANPAPSGYTAPGT